MGMTLRTTSGGETDMLMLQAEDPTPEEKHKAARLVAANARNAQDAVMLLAMLGLDAEDGAA